MKKKFKNVGNSILHLGNLHRVVAVGEEFAVDVSDVLPRDIELFMRAGFLAEVANKPSVKKAKAVTKEDKPTKEAETKKMKVAVKKVTKPEPKATVTEKSKEKSKEDKHTPKNNKAKANTQK